MKTSNDILNLFTGKQYKLCLIDTNSIFLFSGKNSVGLMYSFIEKLRSIFPDIFIINVIDNGINKRVLSKYPYYKGNRNHSIQSNNFMVNKFSRVNSFKYRISQIHKIDSLFKRNLTFYLPGESDFKIGYILKQVHENLAYNKDDILTISIDKDFLLTTLLSDFLLKQRKDEKIIYSLIDNFVNMDLLKVKFNISKLNIDQPQYYYYYLLLNGDKEDNIKKIFTPAKTISFLNNVVEKTGQLNNNVLRLELELIDSSLLLIFEENCYLVDLFNDNVFSDNEKNIMNYNLKLFFNI